MPVPLVQSLDKELGGYEALLGRPWLQPVWFMTGLIKYIYIIIYSFETSYYVSSLAEKAWLCYVSSARPFSLARLSGPSFIGRMSISSTGI